MDMMRKSLVSYHLGTGSLLSIPYSSEGCLFQGTVGTALISSCIGLILKDCPVARTLGNLLSFSSHYGHIKYFLAADLK